MRLSAFPAVTEPAVELMTYRVPRRGHPYYLMIDGGSGWHISVPVMKKLTTWKAIREHDFSFYHATDPKGNHYQYDSRHQFDGTDGEGPFDVKKAHDVVFKMFGVRPTERVDPNKKLVEYRRSVMAKDQFRYLGLFNGAVKSLGRELGGDEVAAFDALEAHAVPADAWYSLMDAYQEKPDWVTFEAAFKPTGLPDREMKRKEPDEPADETESAKVRKVETEPAVPPEPEKEPAPEKELVPEEEPAKIGESARFDTDEKDGKTET